MNERTLRDELADNADLAKALIGVVDLRRGQAVHAVAGQRDQYCGVRLRDGTDCHEPMRLIDHYRSLGVRRFYVADLDAIIDGMPQADVVLQLLADLENTESMIDVGWNGSNELAALASQLAAANAKVIAATETSLSPDVLTKLVKAIGGQSVLLGLDYRHGTFVGGAHVVDDWISTALQLGVHGFVPLDIAAVGTSNAAVATDLCRRIRAAAPDAVIYSGGGIKTAADVSMLQVAGCNGCLVATALL